VDCRFTYSQLSVGYGAVVAGDRLGADGILLDQPGGCRRGQVLKREIQIAVAFLVGDWRVSDAPLAGRGVGERPPSGAPPFECDLFVKGPHGWLGGPVSSAPFSGPVGAAGHGIRCGRGNVDMVPLATRKRQHSLTS
jgi:hypothetical protein